MRVEHSRVSRDPKRASRSLSRGRESASRHVITNLVAGHVEARRTSIRQPPAPHVRVDTLRVHKLPPAVDGEAALGAAVRIVGDAGGRLTKVRRARVGVHEYVEEPAEQMTKRLGSQQGLRRLDQAVEKRLAKGSVLSRWLVQAAAGWAIRVGDAAIRRTS